MLRFFGRQIKRLVVLLPAIVVAYIAVHDIYPIFEHHIPDVPAFFITYVAVAYLLLPFALRIIRIVIKPRHIPLYCTTPDGFACDPINIGIVGTYDQLILVMHQAGWHQADSRSPRNLFRMASSILLRQPYPTAPFSSLYLFGRKQDVGFQLPDGHSPHRRHHIRFWAASYPTSKSHEEHAYFWQRHYSPSGERLFWVGAASRDIGLGLIRHNAQISHRVHHDTDAERDFLVSQLRRLKEVKHVYSKNIALPYKIRNRVLKSHLQADGKIVICQL
ncbi:MAG TPA: LssY C-terminal domain-containing protein [Candidatus Saccharimonadales bacterium]|nr:LssY C-terminal domain-containing protein [Candidatus Saccharimonadales bacterium]